MDLVRAVVVLQIVLLALGGTNANRVASKLNDHKTPARSRKWWAVNGVKRCGKIEPVYHPAGCN